ncbi:hypothetical protein JCM8097_004436 [Rhodosporidiobolus ruineniae]
MLAPTLLSILALGSAVFAAPGEDYGKKDGGKDIFINAEASKKDKELKVSFKEICYRNLYANVEEFKKETEKEILIKDNKGKDVFIFDGFRKDENDVEFYFREFCYKDFNFKKHDEKVDATKIVDINDKGKDGKHYKRQAGFDNFDGLDSGADVDVENLDEFDDGAGTTGFLYRRRIAWSKRA